MKATLFLMTFKGLQVINSVVNNSNINFIDKVIIGRDKNVVRDYSAEIELVCRQNDIKYNYHNEEYLLKSEYGIAISWRWLINESELKLIVLHDSILPKYRGFSPLVNMLINGENQIGVTALFASKEYDKGPIILQKKISIDYPIKIESAIHKISHLYSEIVQEIFQNFKEGKKIISVSQDENKATYSLWRDKNDYFIDWNYSSKKIKRLVDALGFPYGGAKCMIEDKVIIIREAECFEDLKIENRNVGKIIFFDNQYPIVVCATGLLKIKEAFYEDSGLSILPIKKFRTKFI